MQKVLIAHDMEQLLMEGESFFDRTDIRVFTAATNDELLKIHIEESVNLIVTKRDMPGASSEQIFDIIRRGNKLKEVLVIMACESDHFHLERCKRCAPQEILPEPVAPGLLREKVRQYLAVAPRKSYRVVLSAAADGKFRNQSFLCRTENISATGALIRAELDLAVGNVLSCSFYLPDGTKVVAQGQVVRAAAREAKTGERLYGIRYTQIAPDIRDRIEDYIKQEQEYKNGQSSLAS